jgi:hypothetical protein
VTRALLPVLLALPLGCRGTFDLDKYVVDDESGTASSADATATSNASTTTDETTDSTDTNTDTDTDSDCIAPLVDVGSVCIGLEQTLLTGDNAPSDIEVAEFSGDGSLDMLVPGAPVHYFAGTPSGAFNPGVAVMGANGPGLASTDWNQDGFRDFLVISDEGFVIFTSSGGGSFAALGMIPYGGHDAVLGDFDGDGDEDVVLSGPILRGIRRDSGMVSVAVELAYSGQGIAAGSLDGDEFFDLVLAMNSMGQLGLVLPAPEWSFPMPVPYPLSLAADVALADMDGIPGLEVIAVGGASGQVFMGRVEGGAIVGSGSYEVGGLPRAVAIGDIDGDAINDVAVANASSHDVSVLLGQGGSLTDEIRIPVDHPDDSPESIVLADLDGDGRAEIIVGMLISNRVLVYGAM